MSNQNKHSNGYRNFVLVLLTLVYGFNFIDRQIVGILAPFIQKDLGLTNTEMGLLTGLLFAALYTVVAIPIAWLADRYNRVNILTIALATWSGFTALFGLAGNFFQIGLARMGVGIGEAGGSPASHSIISDLYAKEERAGALGIYSMGIPLGIMAAYFVTASLVGPSGEDVNWRRIFVILGLTGIALAVIVRLVLREPVRGAMEFGNNVDVAQPPFLESLIALLKIPSWWWMCFGIALGSFVSYSFSAWQTKYLLLLDPDFNFQNLLLILGVINGTTYAGGTFLGARLADSWGAKNIRAYGWLPAIAISLCLPIGIISFWVPSVESHLILTTVFLLFMGMYLGPSFAIAQTLAPINQRAMSTALFFFILNLIALGGGPTITGWMIDLFKDTSADLESTRYALTVTCLVFVPSILSFLVVARKIPKDWASAEERNLELIQSD
ncbi:MAG: MFS transporter [Porticoccaceae bacterium]|jgi:MFS family permease|nr:MFS transporter [Porticoccaceae bacterium]